jgi:membrane fusion protein (multidrug efflux system)
VTLRAVFPNPDHTLLPGMFVHAQLQAGVNSRGHSGAATGRDRDLRGSRPRWSSAPTTRSNCASSRPAAPSAAWLIEEGLKPAIV